MSRWYCVWGRRSVRRGGTVFPLTPWRVQGREIGPPALGLVSRFRVRWGRVAALKGIGPTRVVFRLWWAWAWDARLRDPVVVFTSHGFLA